MVDYNRLKTPFFEVEVATSESNNFVKIPAQLQKLAKKLEVVETLDNCHYNLLFHLTFIEGSREPFPIDNSTDTSDLYNLDTNKGDSFTNTPGFLPDIKFTEEGGSLGLTSISPDSVSGIIDDSTKITSSSGAVVDEATIDSLEAVAATGEINDIKTNIKPQQKQEFLFDKGNRIKIRWGYKEDDSLQRELIGKIAAMETTFPNNSHPVTKITCTSSNLQIDQKVATRGTLFAKRKTVGTTPDGSRTLEIFEDIPVKEFIENFCEQAGIECVVSDNLEPSVLDKGYAKTLAAGESLDQFIRKLAKDNNAIYAINLEPKTGKEKIFFIAKPDFYSKRIIREPGLLKYKGKNSILMKVDIRAAWDKQTGNARKGKNEKGENVSAARNTPEDQASVSLTEGKKQIEDVEQQLGHNSSKIGETALKNTMGSIPSSNGEPASVGSVDYDAEGNSPANITSNAKNKTACTTSDIVAINFTSVGLPTLTPSLISIEGLGQRYSGDYKIISMTHVIDENGYTCRGKGSNENLYSGRKVSDENMKETEQKEEKKEEVTLTSIPDPSQIGSRSLSQEQSSTPADELFKSLGVTTV